MRPDFKKALCERPMQTQINLAFPLLTIIIAEFSFLKPSVSRNDLKKASSTWNSVSDDKTASGISATEHAVGGRRSPQSWRLPDSRLKERP